MPPYMKGVSELRKLHGRNAADRSARVARGAIWSPLGFHVLKLSFVQT